MSLRGRRVLVTGGTGFIGGRLVEALAGCGARVRVLVRRWARAVRVVRFDVEPVLGCVEDETAIAAAVHGCDVVFHCAWETESDAAALQRASLAGTLRVANAVLAAGTGRLIHVSTLAVYGEARDGPLDETSPWGRPESNYAEAKERAEVQLRQLHMERGLPMVVLQPTIVYGPWGGMWTQGVIDRLRGGPLALPRRGEGLCNAVYVDDVVQALLLAATSDGAMGRTFLVSAAQPVTWKSYYGAFARMLGRGEPLLSEAGSLPGAGAVVPEPETMSHYAARMAVRIDAARSVLHYEPQYALAEGMELTAAWARWGNLIQARAWQ